MNTTELIRPLATRRRASSLSDAGHDVPVIVLAGPWLLLALMLSAPSAVVLTSIAVTLLAAAVLGALTAATLAPPYLLMRHLRSVRARRASSSARAAQLVLVRSARVAS